MPGLDKVSPKPITIARGLNIVCAGLVHLPILLTWVDRSVP